MLLWLKCIYQTLQIKWNRWFYSFFNKKNDPVKLLQARLAARNFSWVPGRPVKVFAIFAVNNWEQEMLKPLSEMGELYHFSWIDGKYFFDNKKDWQAFHERLNADMCKAFDEFYDASSNMVVFIYASDFSVSEQTMERLKKPNVLVISFCWDDILYFKGNVKGQPVGIDKLSRQADINLTLAPESIPRYLYNRSPAFFWKGEALAKTDLQPLKFVEHNPFYVLFVGTKYGWRERLINKLRDKGIDVRCFGEGWENGSLPFNKMWEAVGDAPVTLGFSNIAYTKEMTNIKGRDMEVPLHGGLILTQYSAGLPFYFDLSQDIYVYRSFDECLQRIDEIRSDVVTANKVRTSGYHKALSVATWESRFLYLEQLINRLTAPLLKIK